ncbi:MAG: hypothetical protein U9N54_00925 [candidate division Zixibacteria bacterium]|nr:hypothetical protein [candidate division Zixibacteria bacterium]
MPNNRNKYILSLALFVLIINFIWHGNQYTTIKATETEKKPVQIDSTEHFNRQI